MNNWHFLIRVRGEPTSRGVRWPVAVVIDTTADQFHAIEKALTKKYGSQAILPDALPNSMGRNNRVIGRLITPHIALSWYSEGWPDPPTYVMEG